MKIKTFLALLLLVIVGCSCSKTSNSNVENISFSQIGKGYLYGKGIENIPKGNIVLSTQKDFDILIEKMDKYNITSKSFHKTNIDFNNFKVIAVFSEVKGYLPAPIEITKIIDNGEDIIVTVKEEEKGDIPTMNQSFHIVTIPYTNKRIMFN